MYYVEYNDERRNPRVQLVEAFERVSNAQGFANDSKVRLIMLKRGETGYAMSTDKIVNVPYEDFRNMLVAAHQKGEPLNIENAERTWRQVRHAGNEWRPNK